MVTTEFGEGLKCLPLSIIELRRDLHFELYVKVALRMTLETGHAMSFDPEVTPPLRSRGDLHRHGSRESRHLDLSTECGGHEGNGHTAVKIRAVA